MLKEVTDVLTICGNQANFKDNERYKALCAGAAIAAQATPPEEVKPAEGLAFIESSHPTASTEHTVSNMFEAETTTPLPPLPTDALSTAPTTKENREGLGQTTTLHTTTEILPYVSTPLPGNTCEYCAYCPGKSKEKERDNLPFIIGGCDYCFCRKCSCHHIN